MPNNVKDVMPKVPEAMPALFRATKKLTPEQLNKLSADADHEGIGGYD